MDNNQKVDNAYEPSAEKADTEAIKENNAPEANTAEPCAQSSENVNFNEESATYRPFNAAPQDTTVILENPNDAELSAKGRTALILGIIGIAAGNLCCCLPAGVVLGLIALLKALGLRSLSPDGKLRGFALGGLICGIISIASSVYTFLCLIVAVIDFIFNGGLDELTYQFGSTSF